MLFTEITCKILIIVIEKSTISNILCQLKRMSFLVQQCTWISWLCTKAYWKELSPGKDSSHSRPILWNVWNVWNVCPFGLLFPQCIKLVCRFKFILIPSLTVNLLALNNSHHYSSLCLVTGDSGMTKLYLKTAPRTRILGQGDISCEGINGTK